MLTGRIRLPTKQQIPVCVHWLKVLKLERSLGLVCMSSMRS
jgi:hypothetical protein